MKKLITIVVVISFLAACNNGGEQKATTTDTSKNAESPLTDAVNTADSASKKMQDSISKVKDNTRVVDTMLKK